MINNDTTIIRRIKEAAQGNRLSCNQALAIAEQLDISPLQVGGMADRLGIKISGCQLGCFGEKTRQ